MNAKITITTFSLLFTLATAQQIQFGPKKESQGQLLDKIIAYVGTETITQSELNQVTGGNNTPKMLEELITQKLLVQAAKQRNISINDTTIDDTINRQAQQRGLTREGLISELQSKNLSFSDYREQIRNQLLIRTLQQGIGRSLVDISEREVDDTVSQMKSTGDTVELLDVFVPLPPNASSSIVNAKTTLAKQLHAKASQAPDQLQALASDEVQINRLGNVAVSRIPPSFQTELAKTEIGQVTQPIRDREGLHILKVVNRGNGEPPSLTETKTRHILIKAGDEMSAESARQKIEEVLSLLAQGETFESLASQYSEDIENAGQGGDLGWVRSGQMVPEFENAMQNTQVNQVSQPVRTQFGWHLVKVDARRQAKTDVTEQKRMQARAKLFNERIEEAWALWVQRLREEAYVEIL